MSRVRSRDTKPEMLVRQITHAMGFRYKLHDATLPGKPDLVFPSRRKVIFVHGCFWHRHAAVTCGLARMPKSRENFWRNKLETNRLRDRRNRQKLAVLNWESLVIWECQLANIASLRKRIRSFLNA